MRHRGSVWGFLGGPFGIDVDPLVIARQIGELVDLLLGNLNPAADAKLAAFEGDEFFQSFDRSRLHAD